VAPLLSPPTPPKTPPPEGKVLYAEDWALVELLRLLLLGESKGEEVPAEEGRKVVPPYNWSCRCCGMDPNADVETEGFGEWLLVLM
jgi:hypothetical protein